MSFEKIFVSSDGQTPVEMPDGAGAYVKVQEQPQAYLQGLNGGVVEMPTVQTGTFAVATAWNAGTTTISYTKQGNLVALTFIDVSQDSTGLVIATGIPAALRPATNRQGLLVYEDNTLNAATPLTVTSAGVINYSNIGNGDDNIMGTITYNIN